MRRKTTGGAWPVYAFGAMWLLCALILPMFRLWALLLTIGAAVAVGIIVGKAVSKKNKEAEQKEYEEAKEKLHREAEEAREKAAKGGAEVRYSPEVNAIINDGRLAQKEMGRLYSSIKDTRVRSKINEIMQVSDKICRDAIDDPSDVPQIRKFLDFYLPTTIKLLNAYDRMSAQEIEGENITGSMQRIEDMLDTTIAAYKKQLDALFANQANDIQSDIEVLDGMLAREGLGGKSYLDLKEFMKDYENQQKGSTSNG